jgi:putative membrane protein
MVRLFIYHTETKEKSELEAKILSEQYKIMEKKLWFIITTPAMILTVVFGLWMLLKNDALLKQPWMHIKLSFVVLLLIYHFLCQRIMNQLKRNEIRWTSTKLRLWNELATLFLVAIVFLVELQTTLDWVKGTVGFFLVGILLMIAVKIYKHFCQKNK